MTTAQAGRKRPPGRPSNAQQLRNSQSKTLTAIFASTTIDPKSKKKKGSPALKHPTKQTARIPNKTDASKKAPAGKSGSLETITNAKKDRGSSENAMKVTHGTINEESDTLQRATYIAPVGKQHNMNQKKQNEKSENQEVIFIPEEPMDTDQNDTSHQINEDTEPEDVDQNVEFTPIPQEKNSEETSSQSAPNTEMEDDPPTPVKTNSTKNKRVRKRGKKGNRSTQRKLFELDSRDFKVTNINKTRFDLSFKTEAGSNAPEIGQKKIQELLEACQDYSDESITIIPWKESDIGICPLITEVEDVPKQLSQMKVYLPRFRPSAKGGINYTSIFLGHDCSASDLLLDISFWISDSGFKLFRKSIQAEASVILGWFLYGIREINTTNLQEAIENTEGNPQVGLRQMRIRTSVTGKASNIRALGIECDARHEKHVKECLVQVYHSKRTKWPNGVKLRYMRDPRFLCGAQALNKTKHLLGRHERFQEGIMVRRSRDVLSLDIVDADHNKSLRDIIMNIKSNKKPTMSVFHSIDPAFNQDDTYVFTFLPDFATQADQILAQLVPYTVFLEGDYVTKFFSAEALSKSEGCIWDKDKGCAISALDQELEDIEQLDDGYDFANPINPSNTLNITIEDDNLRNSPNTRTLFGNDTDSISTLGNKIPKGSKPNPIDTSSVVSSLGSNISLRSKASIVTAVKKDIEEGLRDSIANILKEELAKMASAPFKAVNHQTNGQARLTPENPGKETNALPSSTNNTDAGPERGAGQA